MKTPLQRIVFEVTERCNLDCKFCYNPWKGSSAAPVMKEGYRRARKTLKRLFRTAEVRHVAFSGGEPLLAERIHELVLFARMKRASVNIISNGTLADGTTLRRFRDIGVDRIQFSLHADRALEHENLTGVAGSWEKVCKAFRAAKECGLRTSGVLVLTAVNVSRLENTLGLLADLGAESVLLNRFNVGGRGIVHREALDLDRDTLRRAFSLANDFAVSRGLPIHSGVCTPVCMLDPRDYPALTFGRCGASIRQTPLTLDVAGNLRACNHSPVNIGNIFENTIEEMEASSYLHEWADSRPGYCSGCGDFERCFAGCRAAAEQLGRGLDVDPVLIDRR